MNNALIDFYKRQLDIKNSLMPKSAVDLWMLQQKNQPHKNVLKTLADRNDLATRIQGMTAAVTQAIPKIEFPKSAVDLFSVGNHYKSIVEESPALKMLSRSNAVTNNLYNTLGSPAVRAAVDFHRTSNSNFIADLFKTSQFFEKNNFLSVFQQSAVSDLNTSLKFYKAFSKNFKLPDFSEIKFEDELEDQRHIIIQIDPHELSKTIRALYEDHDRLKTINPRKFEEVIAELLGYHGYDVKLTKQSRDGGFDMTLCKTLDDGSPFRAIVECKRHKKKIDVNIVRCFSAVAYREGIRDGIIVTTSTFTKDAITESRLMPACLSLKDKKDVLDWAGSYLGKIPYILSFG